LVSQVLFDFEFWNFQVPIFVIFHFSSEEVFQPTINSIWIDHLKKSLEFKDGFVHFQKVLLLHPQYQEEYLGLSFLLLMPVKTGVVSLRYQA
jgi:hypothetical protein